MAYNFEIERSAEGTKLDRLAVQGVSLSYVPGLCTASVSWPDSPRDIEWYKQHVITPLIASGKIGDGVKTKFDDRKFRLHATSLKPEQKVLEIALGMTHFNEYVEYNNKDKGRTDEDNRYLQEMGLRRLGERWAYFGRAPGVGGMVISSDGHAVLGERVSN